MMNEEEHSSFSILHSSFYIRYPLYLHPDFLQRLTCCLAVDLLHADADATVGAEWPYRF